MGASDIVWRADTVSTNGNSACLHPSSPGDTGTCPRSIPCTLLTCHRQIIDSQPLWPSSPCIRYHSQAPAAVFLEPSGLVRTHDVGFWLLFCFPRALHGELPRYPPHLPNRDPAMSPTTSIDWPKISRQERVAKRKARFCREGSMGRWFGRRDAYQGLVRVPILDKRVPGGLGSEERGVLYSRRAPTGEMQLSRLRRKEGIRLVPSHVSIERRRRRGTFSLLYLKNSR